MQTTFALLPSNAPTAGHGDIARPSNSNAANFSKICTLMLQSQQHYCVQDAATFSKLLCVSQQVHDALLPAAVRCLKARLTRYHGCSCSSNIYCLVSWICKHLDLGTIRCLEIEASDFQPSIHEALAQQLAAGRGGTKQLTAEGAGCSSGPLRKVMAMLATPAPWAAPALSLMGAAGEAAAAAAMGTAPVLPKHTVIKISWHVCGLPPSWLSEIPGALLTHLTLRDLRLSQVTLQHLPRLTTLQQLHLPNLNPEPASLAPALAALTALTQLFIRDPCAAVQQALPVSLQQLTVAQRTPPWVAAPALQPLQLQHLTALSNLTVQEWFARGITEGFALPHSLQQLAVPCLSSALPLLALKRLKLLQLSSLKHSSPQQLLQLRSLPALTAVQLGSEAPPACARLLPTDLRAYAQVFTALPVHLTALTVLLRPSIVQPGDVLEARAVCADSLRALAALTSLRGLSLEGGHSGRPPAAPAAELALHQPGLPLQQPEAGHSCAINPAWLAEALAQLTVLTMLRLSHVQLAPRAIHSTSASSLSSSSRGSTAAADTATATAAAASNSGSGSSSSSNSSNVRSLLVNDHTAVPGYEASPGGRVAEGSREVPRDGWVLLMHAVAALPGLRRLICKGLDLGPAAGCLSAAKKLAHLELFDCGVAPAVVQRLLQGLASSCAGTNSVAASHVVDLDVCPGGNGNSGLDGVPCEAEDVLNSGLGSLTCLKFSNCL